MIEIDDQHMTPRERHDAREREAADRSRAAGQRSSDAQAAVNHAENAIRAFQREHATRRPLVLEGIDRSAEAAREALRDAVANQARHLASPVPVDLTALAGLWLQTQPDFLDALREAVGELALSDVTDDEYEAGVAVLRAERSAALQAAATAQTEAREANERLRVVQYGNG